MPKYKFNSTPERSFLMSKIRSKNTKSEIKLRKALWAAGLRFRVHDKKLPGKPDIVLKKYKLAIFVDGEFWHGKDWEVNKLKIKSNQNYWIPKIEKNISRDKEIEKHLALLGFEILRFWSRDIEKHLGIVLKAILDTIFSKDISLNSYLFFH